MKPKNTFVRNGNFLLITLQRAFALGTPSFAYPSSRLIGLYHHLPTVSIGNCVKFFVRIAIILLKISIGFSQKNSKKSVNFLLTSAYHGAIMQPNSIAQTVEAEITAMMPLQRACDAENQARNKLSNGPLRVQSNKFYLEYSATCWHT